MKTLIFDIETAPLLANCWGLWDQSIGLDMIEADWYVLSYSAKWLGAKEVMYDDQEKAKDIEDDTLMLKGIWRLLDECDVAVAHNGIKFDVKKLNTRFLLNGLGIPSPYKVVDTLRIAKANFAMTSNKLEYLSGLLSSKPKLKHAKFPGFKLWKECLARNPEAWAEMKKYNIRDTVALEEVYLKLRAWNKQQPNAGVYLEKNKPVCSKCGHTKLQARGFSYTSIGKYQRYQCTKCGGWSRDRHSHTTQDVKATLLTNC